VRHGNQSIVPSFLLEAMGDDWKRWLAATAFSGLSANPEWDGQSVSFRFRPIIEDGKEVAIEVESYFDVEERK